MRTLITIVIGFLVVGCLEQRLEREAVEDAEAGVKKAQQDLDDFNEGAEKLTKLNGQYKRGIT